MNKIVLALAIMATTGAIIANTVGLAHAVNPQPLPPGIMGLQLHPPGPCIPIGPIQSGCTIPPAGLLAHYPTTSGSISTLSYHQPPITFFVTWNTAWITVPQ